MKRIIILLSCFCFLVLVNSSCEDLLDDENCAECCLVITDSDGSEVSREKCAEYCGAELTLKQASIPQTIGDETSSWECD